MPPFEEMDRYEKAVLWLCTGINSYGERTVAAPVEINVRWNKTRTDSQGSQDSDVKIEASVVVNQVITVGSTLWLGTLASWNATNTATNDSEVMIVVSYRETPSLKNEWRRREVDVSKYRNLQPSLTS